MKRIEEYKENFLEFVNEAKPETEGLIKQLFEIYETERNRFNNDRYSPSELNTEIKFLDLSNQDLTELPEEIFNCKDLLALDLSENKLKSLKGLEKLPNLNILLLEECGLDDFPEEIFFLKNLITINLDSNNIRNISQRIENLNLLTGLNLSYNEIENLPIELFKISNLSGLYLDGNSGINFPDLKSVKSNLKVLEVSDCKILDASKLFSFFPKLIRIDLSSNSIRNFPDLGCSYNNLEKIYLSNNSLRDLPNNFFKYFPNLLDLYLSSNNIIELNCDFENASKLTLLNLVSNKLKFLPDSLTSLTSLLILRLPGNRIVELPEKIGDLRNLEILDVSFNRLEKLPNSIGKLKKLTHLFLNNNSINELPVEIGGLDNLTSLILGNERFGFRNSREESNNLKVLPLEIGKLKNLTTINLNNNSLNDLPNEFANLRKLTSLDIEGNLFEDAPDIVEMGIDELFEFLNKRRGEGEFDFIWEVPQSLQSAFQRYFDNFTNFFYKTKGEQLQFEVVKDEKGLIFRLHPTENISFDSISSSLVEYISLLEQDKDNISINIDGQELSKFEFDLLVADIKEEKRSFEMKMKLAEMEAKHLNQQVQTLNDQLNNLRELIYSSQAIALEQAKASKAIGSSINSSRLPNIHLSNSSSNLNANTNLISVSIEEFHENVVEGIGEIKSLIHEADLKGISKDSNEVKELIKLKCLLEESLDHNNREEVKKSGLKGFLRKFINGSAKIFTLINDSETVDSLKTILKGISQNIDQLA